MDNIEINEHFSYLFQIENIFEIFKDYTKLYKTKTNNLVENIIAHSLSFLNKIMYNNLIIILINFLYYIINLLKFIINKKREKFHIIHKEKLLCKNSQKKIEFSDKNDNKNNLIRENTINKRNKNIIKNKCFLKKKFDYIKYILILSLSAQILLDNINIHFIAYQFSKISLKIKGIGYKKIFSSEKNEFLNYLYPDEIYIKGEIQNISNHTHYFNQTENFVELIWTKPLRSCRGMFYGCSDISELDLSNFDASEVTSMMHMFRDCISLTSINLNDLNTSKVESFWNLFRNCKSLTSVNLSSFDSSKVTDMDSMFLNCHLLTSINITHFKTSRVGQMQFMFQNCSLLTSLNLSNFDTSIVTRMEYMFDGCENLEYINLKNFNETKLNKFANIFRNVPGNVIICINENDTKTKIFPQIEIMTCNIIDCTDDWKKNQKIIINNNFIDCVHNCANNIEYQYYKCYSNCSNEILYEENNINKCKCELTFNQKLCSMCSYNYYINEYIPSNINESFNCYKAPPEFYLDTNEFLYKKCYDTCQICDINSKTNYSFGINNDNNLNNYEKFGYYYFNLNNINNNIYQCKINFTCPKGFTNLLEEKNECKIEDIKYIDNLIENILVFEDEEKKTKEEEIKIYNEILVAVDSIFSSNNYDFSNIDKGEEQIIKAQKLLITLTNTINQKNNYASNMTTIDLGECEKLLRHYYNLSNNETIYMKKIEIVQDGTSAKKIEFDLYSKLSENKIEKLNLEICEKTRISINIPIEIQGNLDKFNTSSGYFNDICYTTTSDSGTDISLTDRKKNYFDNDNIICQEYCYLSEYDSDIKKAKCECKAKKSSSTFEDMTIDKSKLFNNFKNIKNSVNINILICYKKLLYYKDFLYNIGSLIIIFIIIFHIISILIFYLKQKSKILKIIKNIMHFVLNENPINNNKNKISRPIIFKKKKFNLDKNNKNFKIPKYINNFAKVKKNIRNKKSNNNKRINLINNKRCNKYRYNYINKKSSMSSVIPLNNYSRKEKFKLEKRNQNNIKYSKIYNENEKNELSYNLALIYDKRTYCEYYNSLLKAKHNLIFSFCNNGDYNSKIVKIDLFFVEFTIFYTINALFFNEDTIHNIYIFNGSFDLETQLPLALYSSVISIVLDKPLSLLALSNDNIIHFKNNISNNIAKRGKILIFYLKTKFLLYFILSFIFLLFFWYYITMFGIIYKNTKYHLLKDTLISFCLSLIYPFGIYLLPGFFRIPSLSNPRKKRKCLFNFSKILQLL